MSLADELPTPSANGDGDTLPAPTSDDDNLFATTGDDDALSAVPFDALATLVAPLGVVAHAERLTGGFFATSYRVVLADGTRVVVKTAPTGTDRLLTYERDLLRTEASVYRLGHDRPELLMPRVLLTDWSRTVLPGDVVVVSHLDGVPLVDAGFEPDDPRSARAAQDLGRYMSRLHAVQGERFGYLNPATGIVGATWTQAVVRMVDTVLADGARWGSPVPFDEVRAAVARHAGALDDVTRPALVHTDLWPGNVFVDPSTGELTGVIDTERAVWGDPLLDVLGADPMSLGPVSPVLLAGYAQGPSEPMDVTSPSAVTRLTLYRLLGTLVMTVEVAPRAYEGDWVPGHVTTLAANLRSALDALA